MEYYSWVLPWNEIGAEGQVYLGDEGCGRFLDSPGALKRILSLLNQKRLSGLITPFLTPEREQGLIELLKGIQTPIEVVVNDVGAFQIVKKSRHIPVIGRLLARQHTDPAIMAFGLNQPGRCVFSHDGIRSTLRHVPPPDELMRHFRGTPLFTIETSGFLLGGYPDMRVMLDRPLHGLPKEIPDRYSVILNEEEILVSILPCSNCGSCPDSECFMGKTRFGVPIYRRRNTCYFKYSEVRNVNESGGYPDFISGIICKHHY